MALAETSVAVGLFRPGRMLAGLVRRQGELYPWVPVLMAAGIAVYFGLAEEPSRTLIAAAGCAFGLALALRATAARGAASAEGMRILSDAAALVVAGFLLAVLRAHLVAAPVLPFRYYGPVEGRVVEIDRSFSDAVRLTLDRVVLFDVAPERTPERVRVALHDDAAAHVAEPGTVVMLTGHLAPPEGPVSPGGFDFQELAWFMRLGAVGYTRSPVLRIEAPPGGATLAALRVRMALSRAMQERIGGQAGALSAAFMTGDRSAITAETNEVMRASNLSHMISISGLHMALVVAFVFGLVRYGLALIPAVALRIDTKAVAAVTALIAATGYLALAGRDVATERAWIMAAVMLAAILVRRRALTLRAVSVAATVVLVLRPESLVQPGFQMSFGATVALILAFRKYQEVQGRIPGWLRPLVAMVLSSAVAGLVTGPVAAAHFNRVAGYGLVANLLATPVMGLAVMPAGVVAAILAPVGLAGPALWVMGWGSDLILRIAEMVAGWEGAVVGVVAPTGWVLPALGFGACVAVLSRGAGRALAVAVMLAGIAGWMVAERPAVLISAGGEMVAVRTPQGLAPSRPKGAGFVVTNWLEDDGDPADQETAFARGAFDGARGQSLGHWNGREIIHLTGKTAPDRAPALCSAGRILVVGGRVEASVAGACDLWDSARLSGTGAVALYARGGEIVVRSARDAAGTRLWSRWKDRSEPDGRPRSGAARQ